MNALRQFVHILAKDIRGHLPEIGVVLLLNVAVTLVLTQSWEESFESTETTLGIGTQVLLIVAWCVLIARVVQDDGVAGKAPYWLTRPCSRPALLAAKLAFVVLFLHLPSFVGQLAIVTGSGVPLSLAQLLLNQAVFAACLSLPLLALAALTTTFSRFVFAGVAVTAIALVALVLFVVRNNDLAAGSSPAGVGAFYTGLGTFVLATQLAILALIASVALACQYRWRSALRVAVGSGIAVTLLGLGMLTLPSSLIQRARAAVVGLPTVASTIRLRDVSERQIYDPDVIAITLVVSLPIEIPDTFDEIVRYYKVQVRSADGRAVRLLDRTTLRTSGSDRWLDLRMSQADYDALKDNFVSVRLIVEIETYESRAMEPIPLDGGFAIVGGRAQCGTRSQYAPFLSSVSCRTSFGWSHWYFNPANGPDAQLLWLPLRLQFAINPVRRVQFGPRAPRDPLLGTEIATAIREPVRYTRQDVTFENVRLGDWGP